MDNTGVSPMHPQTSLFQSLLTSANDSPTALAVAEMMCPTGLFERAADLADGRTGTIKRQEIVSGMNGFVVVSKKLCPGESYFVIPGAYCSCRFFQEQVMKGSSWTCKHDIAVMLRLGLGGVESIPQSGDIGGLIRKLLAAC